MQITYSHVGGYDMSEIVYMPDTPTNRERAKTLQEAIGKDDSFGVQLCTLMIRLHTHIETSM
jgi:hypothetical protein